MRQMVGLGIALSVLLSACGDGRSESAESGLYFPTAGSNDEAVMAALFQGTLVVRDDCVLAGGSGNYTFPIWREGFSAARDDQGLVEVRDPDGVTVAIEGRGFEMGGGYIAEFGPKDKVDPWDVQLQQVAEMTGNTIPERCLGPDVYGVWWVGDTEPLST